MTLEVSRLNSNIYNNLRSITNEGVKILFFMENSKGCLRYSLRVLKTMFF